MIDYIQAVQPGPLPKEQYPVRLLLEGIDGEKKVMMTK